MAILNIQTVQTGLVGVLPSIAYIYTDSTETQVLTAGFLNQEVQNGTSFQMPCMALVSTKATPTSQFQVGMYQVSHVGANWSLVPAGSPGDVVLPTIANHIATYTNTTGTLSEDPATAISGGNIQAGLSGTAGYLATFPATLAKGSLRLVGAASAGDTVTQITNASMAAARVFTIPDGGQAASNFIISDSAGTQTIATGSLALTVGNLIATAGNVQAGSDAHAGTLISYPSTTANGSLIISALNAGGAFNTTVRNSVMGQASVISIPDPGAATANFLLDTGASNILAQQQFVGISNVLTFGTGTWTVTRIAQGNYVSRHTAADETSIIAIDITPIIRAAAAKGFRLDSFDYIYSIGTLAMDAHSLTLDRIAYANNVAVSVTSIPVTATLATATQANPYVTNCTVTSPAFDVTADSKYVIEITADNAATTAFDFYGIMLRFSQTIG
jgi:hypothetical protein